MITLTLLLTRFYELIARWPGLVSICHKLAGVDRRMLARAPKPEQAAYTAVGCLMLLSATWTGVSMAMKVGSLEGAQSFALMVLAAVFFFAVALAMEVLVLSTLKTGSYAMISARVALSAVLVAMQVLPFSIRNYESRIAYEQHQQTLASVTTTQAAAAKARGVDVLQVTARDLQVRAEAAQKALDEPGTPPQVVAEADSALAKATKAFATATRGADDARARLAKLRTGLNDPKLTAAGRDKLETAINVAAAKLVARQSEVNRADAAVANARTDADAAHRAWRTGLENGVAGAKDAVEVNAKAVAAAAARQAEDVERAEELSNSANKPGFLTSLGVLIHIAMHDKGVMFSLLFALAVASLVDLLPLLGKTMLLNGVHARGVRAREVVEIARLNLAEDQTKLDCEGQHLLAQQEYEALRKWTSTDKGATQATEFALAAQKRLASAQLAQTAELTGEWAGTMKGTLEKLYDVQMFADKSPTLTPVFRAHLARLITSLEEQIQTPGSAKAADAGA